MDAKIRACNRPAQGREIELQRRRIEIIIWIRVGHPINDFSRNRDCVVRKKEASQTVCPKAGVRVNNGIGDRIQAKKRAVHIGIIYDRAIRGQNVATAIFC